MSRYENILGTIGNTPVVRLDKLAPKGINLYAKIESFNPMGSVKDRLALGVIEHAERTGALKPGQTVIEATSGNTGIGLAMVCARKGYPLVVTMAESFSIERRKMMRFLGARVVLTPASLKGTGMLAKAEELAAEHGWYLCRQFDNEANADAHSQTTAVEILADFADIGLDYWVTGYGTGGTLKGVARVLKERSPRTGIVVCEPDNSPLLGSGVKQAKAAEGAPLESHPFFRPHLMQGWSPDFIAGLTEDAVDLGMIDRIIPVAGADAILRARELAREEGIFVGITGGATLAGALSLCADIAAGSNVLCMLPDTGERYLSTPLFDDISVEMTAEEIGISQSTPGYRFDAPPPKPSAEPESQLVTPEAGAFVRDVTREAAEPVVMFALEWCEFCWSVRKMFGACAIQYRSVDLDSVEYQQDDFGGQIRAALAAQTGSKTIPQIFVGGEFIGGCTETFDAFKDGRLQKMLTDKGVSFNKDVDLDPYDFLPKWLHSR